jgi:hypothetical protein
MCQKGSKTGYQYNILESWHQSLARLTIFFEVLTLSSFFMNKTGYCQLRCPLPNTLLQTSKVMAQLLLYEP